MPVSGSYGGIRSSLIIPSFQGAGDVVSSAFAWWGLRAYTFASIGSNAIDIEWNDSTIITYATIAGGGLPLTTMTADQTTHGAPGKVNKLWDQTGNGNHIVTITSPTFNFTGLGSLPSIDALAASSQHMGTASLTQPNLPMTFVFVAKHTASAAQQLFSGTGASPGGAILYRSSANNQVALFNGSATAPLVTCPDGQFNSVIGNFTSPSSNSFITVGGVDSGTGDPGTGGGASGVYTLFSDGGGGQDFDGSFAEWGIWASAFSGTQRTNMYNNHHAYYGV